MAQQRFEYFVGVAVEGDRLKWVTKVDNVSKIWLAEAGKPPLSMSKSVAHSLMECMAMNMTPAVVVEAPKDCINFCNPDNKEGEEDDERNS